MAKKKSKSQKENVAIAKIHFGSIDYVIESLDYSYSFTQDRIFQFSVTVIVPVELFPEPFLLQVDIPSMLSLIEHKHAAMAQYVQKTIDSFDDPHFQEELAFKALEEDGFDFQHFARCALNEMEVELFWEHDMPPPTPQVKIVRFGEIDYDIEDVQISYGNKEEREFTFHVSIQLPKHIFEQAIMLNMPLHQVLKDVEKQDAAMANYVKKALAENQNETDPEVYTIQALLAEDFDLHLFLRHSLKDFSFKIEKK